METDSRTQERIARMRLEDERNNRPITNLSKLQKKVLRYVYSESYDNHNGIDQFSPEGVALTSLNDLGLVRLICTKDGLGAIPTPKGKLLLYENPKLRFPVSENVRWIITTVIAVAALVLGIIK